MAKTIREQYLKERRRIQRFIRSATKRGYIIPENILPDIPKRVTRASVSRLKKITPERIYSKSQYVSRETGEIKTGKAGRAEERKAASRKATETRRRKEETSRAKKEYIPRASDIILSNLRETLVNFVPSGQMSRFMQENAVNNRNYALGILDDAIKELGEEQVAKNIQKNALQLSRLIEEILYSSDRQKVKFSLVEFYNIIHDGEPDFETNMRLSEEQETIETGE